MKSYNQQRITNPIIQLITLCMDYSSIVLGLMAAYHLRLTMPFFVVSSQFKLDDIYTFLIVPIVFLCALCINDAYNLELPYWDKIKNIFRSITIGTVVSIVLMYAGHVTNDVSRLFVGFTYIFTLLFTVIFRFIGYRILYTLGVFRIPVLLIGAGKTAELVLKSLERMPIPYYEIIGYVDDQPKSQKIASVYTHLGTFDDIEKVIEMSGVQHVLICAPGLASKRLVNLINRLQLLVRKVFFVPELFGLPTSNISVRGLMEEQAVILRVQNNLARKSNRLFKRLFDIVATVLGGILILPIVGIISLLIYIDSPGPIVFGHKRVGQNGKEFPCYKFRSMILNAQEYLEEYLKNNPEAREEWERDFKLKDDPRVTKIGKFLRKTSLDELPQLWNVLIGDMSLVGPRPIVRAEVEKYGDYINDFYLVPPGITGVWQVSGRSDTTYEERVLMDSWYVHNWSVWIDIVYLVKTVLAVVKGKGAY